MKKVFIITAIVILFSHYAQCNQPFRIMFYNVENLFDTKHDSLKNDYDFLPDGFMNWNLWKYWQKQRNICRVITALGEMHSPALIGLCEVENDSVVYDLTKRSPLRNQDYEYIMTDSPDWRGIDVALLYQRHQFKLIEKNEYEVYFSTKRENRTRNILHAVGEIINGDTLDIFVCHFPSRYGGQLESESKRIDAATRLKSKTDSIFLLRKNCNIIIMGDFNDAPNDKSIYKTLNAKSLKDNIHNDKLYNMFLHRVKKRRQGTYKHKGVWTFLDQFIVSGNLLRKESNINIKNNEANVFNPSFLNETDETYGGVKPFRTNLGPRYLGGFSDHYPIYLDLVIYQDSDR